MDRDVPEPTQDPVSYEILTGIYEWRLQHPEATLTEIEQALDERWYRVRARMLQDLALRSQATNWQATSAVEQPSCPDCGRPLVRRGQQPRTLKTHGGQNLTLTRSYGYCGACKKGHFPPR
jgi:hypothetical protein